MSIESSERLESARSRAGDRAIILVRSLLGDEVRRLRASGQQPAEDPYRGLYISDAEVDAILRRTDREDQSGPGRAELLQAIDELTLADSGRLGCLRRSFDLDRFEAACIVFLLVVETDLGSERLVAYAQDDVTKRQPRIDLALRLLTGPKEQPHERALEREAPLRRFGLVDVHEEPGQPHTPFTARLLALGERPAAYLAGSNEMDGRVALGGTLIEPQEGPCLIAPEFAATVAGRLAERELADPPLAHGLDRLRLAAAARELTGNPGSPVLAVDLPRLLREPGLERVDAAFRVAHREAVLQNAVLLLCRADALEELDRERLRSVASPAACRAPVVIAADQPTAWPGVEVAVDPPGYGERLELWSHHLHGVAHDDIAAVASRFSLHTEEIARAASSARNVALARGPRAIPTREEILAAGRQQSAPALGDLAVKVTHLFSWDDIVLPADTVAPLRELCASVEHRHRVFQSWGFERKVGGNSGVIALFAGESGTGKTMAAGIVAGHLGLDLYKIDLSGVVSKYIGETEKNLKNVFDQAQRSSAILFFDEADALFGKRSEVKDAHDRYANIETAYLLQRMEAYEGIVILATNLKLNIDEAFLRRMHFVLDFPMPDEAAREKLWRSMLPDELPVAGDVDFDYLARSFRLSGGNIRNVVLAASFLAADEGCDVQMRHFIRAVRREYQKLGRMVTPQDFGPYMGLIANERTAAQQ